MERPERSFIVVFRKDRDGWREPFALFPELPADKDGLYCTCYQQVGQHCAADYGLCITSSDPASPAEYADLLRELRQIGYKLAVRKRASNVLHDRRRQAARHATYLVRIQGMD